MNRMFKRIIPVHFPIQRFKERKGANQGKSDIATRSKTKWAKLHSNDSTTHVRGDHPLTYSRSPIKTFTCAPNCRNCAIQWFFVFTSFEFFNCKLSLLLAFVSRIMFCISDLICNRELLDISKANKSSFHN